MNRAGVSLFRATGPYCSRASFSTTPATRLDLSNLYSKLTGWRRKKPANAVVDPTQGRESEKSDDSMPVDSRPRKLKILGKPKDLEEDWEAVREYAEFMPWPTNHYRSDLSKEKIESILSSIRDTDFGNFQSRLSAVKQVSTEAKIAIPDSVLSTLNSLEDLKVHLLQSARPFDERQPDAVYLNPEEFIGTNITISDPVSERKSQKKKMHELVQEARKAQKQAADEIMRAT